MSNKLILSPLGHTWIFDIDGTIVKHNGYKLDGHDTLLPGVKEFFENQIRKEDYVILVTSRTNEYKKQTIDFLNYNEIKFNDIIFNLPYGERIVINDSKPSGLEMSKCVNFVRNKFDLNVIIDKKI